MPSVKIAQIYQQLNRFMLNMPSVAYNPLYDPLTSLDPGSGVDYAPSYWVASAGKPPQTDGPVTQDIDTDVVIIGSGSTGVSTALYLAQEHGIQATILEANQTAWGCSSRSGGQGQNASGRLSRSQWIERWGLDTAKKLDREIYTGFENFKELVSEIDCDAFDGGHLYIAHRPEKMIYLQNEAKVRKEIFGYDPLLLSAQEVREQYCDDHDAAGALLEREGVGIHPLKFTFGLLKKAQTLGVKIHTASPALGWETINGVHHIQTPGGVVRAKRIAICTGGYGVQGLKPIKNKILPILSNSLVTRPLTEAEIKACNFRSNTFLTDTRTLRFYYRLLKDQRLQIGSRSSIGGTDAIWWPQLLYKPVRSTYYTIKGNIAMVKQDFDAAEKHLKHSNDLGSAMPEAEGANKLQLGMMAMQKGDIKQGESYIRAAIRAGIPDKESEAVAFLSMCQIFMNKREFRAAKDYFRKAKACKPTTKQVIDQIKEIEKYISRMPG